MIALPVGLIAVSAALLIAERVLARVSTVLALPYLEVFVLMPIAALGSSLVVQGFDAPQWVYWALVVPLGGIAVTFIIRSSLIAARIKRDHGGS